VQAHYTLASAYIGLGRMPEGTAQLEASVRLDPRSVPKLQSLQRCYQAQGLLDREIDALTRLTKLQPNDADSYIRLGQNYLRLYWLDKATACLTRAVQLAPESAAANLEMAKCEWQAGQAPAAVARLQQSHAGAPDDIQTTDFLAQYLLATGKAPEAEAVLREGLRRHSGDRLLTLTLVYNLLYQGGQKRFQEVIDLGSDFLRTYGPMAEIYCWLGRAYDGLGLTRQALASFQQAVKLDPGFENATYLLGQHYVRSGKTAEGQRLITFYTESTRHLETYVHAEEAVRTHPADADAHLAVARLDMLSHYFPEAIVEFKEVLSLRPNDTTARQGLRNALAASGRRAEVAGASGHNSLP
jgi:tetratricopeptide (TPR) repeat protein